MRSANTARVRTDSRLAFDQSARSLTLIAALFALAAGSTGCLNPETLNAAFGTYYPVAPGNTPFLMARVINDTSGVAEQVPIIYDDGSTVPPVVYITSLNPQGREEGVVLHWPVYRLAIGSLTDPYMPSIKLTIQNQAALQGQTGTTTQPSAVTVGATQVPFGHPALQAGVDYNRGDVIVFRLVEDVRSSSFIRVDISRIDATQGGGDGSRADTFANLWQLLATKGFMDVIPLGGGT